LRIDSHHSSSERYPLAHLKSILARNRFDTSIAVVREAVPMWHILWAGAQGAADPWCCGVWARIPDVTPRILGAVAGRSLDLDLEMGSPREACGIAAAHPEIAVVLQAGQISGAAEFTALARVPNLYVKAAGVLPRETVRLALEAFGPSRMMFGSNWPAGLPEVTWKATLAAFTQAIGAQPVDVREELLGGTAARVYRLAAAGAGT